MIHSARLLTLFQGVLVYDNALSTSWVPNFCVIFRVQMVQKSTRLNG